MFRRRARAPDPLAAWDTADDPLTRLATEILREFLNGARPPRCRRRWDIAARLEGPANGRAWQWLLDNGFVERRYVPGVPVVREGPHAYGHPEFDGYCVTPGARDAFRRLFGENVWT